MNHFTEYLEIVFEPSDMPVNATDEEITMILEQPLQNLPPIKFFTPKEVSKTVQQELHVKKSLQVMT